MSRTRDCAILQERVGCRVKVNVESWNDDSAMFRARYRGKQFRRDCIGSRRTEADDRIVRLSDLLSRARDHGFLPRCTVNDASFLQDLWPSLECNIQKVESQSPILIKIAIKLMKVAPSDFFNDHFIDQFRQFTRKVPRIHRMGADKKRFGCMFDYTVGNQSTPLHA